MQEAAKYREFANECRRLAAKAKAPDKAILLEVAEAWDKQAKLVEASSIRNPERKPDGHDAAG